MSQEKYFSFLRQRKMRLVKGARLKLFLFFLTMLACLVNNIESSSNISSPGVKRQEQQKEIIAEEKEKEKEKEKERQLVLQEEVVVIGKTPKDTPLATVTRLSSEEIQLHRPADLAEAIRQVPGVSISLNNKNEFSLRLRGMEAQRITLLIDGVPVYEPFFASFDLKTLPASGVEAIQITTGVASALYGPNTLAGVINVISRRPTSDPFLRLSASGGELRTSGLTLEGAGLFGRIGGAGSFNYQSSGGFYYSDGNSRKKRVLSDYDRFNFNLKVTAYPGAQSELFASLGLYRSSFGVPPAISLVKPRYWRFKNWDRDLLSVGGLHAVSPHLSLLWRGYWVRYNNSLEQYKDSSLTALQALSTYHNDLLGFFLLGDYFPQEKMRWRTSFFHRQETARLQDNTDLPFESYRHQASSLGWEGEFTLTSLWRIVTGFSLDRLHKADATNLFRFNPLAGIIFSPADSLSFRFSFSLKSRFPSMHSLYSSLVGNPDLVSETGKGWEAGLIWDEWASLRLTAFANHFHNMIEAVRLADGTRKFRNLTSARINGIEAEIKKSISHFSFGVAVQWLDHRNETENRPLDTLPSRQVSGQLSLMPWSSLCLTLSGVAASHSFWYDLSSRQQITIPGYETIDFIISFAKPAFEFYFKATNLLNKFFYTEPGAPWRGRYFEAGLSLNIF